jgi:hypothetical protein
MGTLTTLYRAWFEMGLEHHLFAASTLPRAKNVLRQSIVDVLGTFDPDQCHTVKKKSCTRSRAVRRARAAADKTVTLWLPAIAPAWLRSFSGAVCKLK